MKTINNLNNKQFKNQFNLLKQIVMKKQLLLLIVAFFAVTTAFGQAVNNPAILPVPLTCTTNDPLNPIAGKPYNYEAIIAPTGGTAYWYATKSTTFTTGAARVATEIPADGVAILNTATNYRTSAVAGTSPTSTNVTWTSAGLAGVTATNPLFMVVEYDNSAVGCANNIKVMKIVPKVAFTVDITSLKHDDESTLAYGTAESQCFDDVQSVTYVDPNIVIDYGTNVLYYEVVAANFTDSYLPTFQISGLSGSQEVSVDWGYSKGAYTNNLLTDVAAAATVTTPQATVLTSATSTTNGVSIYVRVTVKNNGFEGTTNQNIALAVEAVDAQANADVDVDCSTITAYGDIATQTLNARPSVTAGTPQIPQIP